MCHVTVEVGCVLDLFTVEAPPSICFVCTVSKERDLCSMTRHVFNRYEILCMILMNGETGIIRVHIRGPLHKLTRVLSGCTHHSVCLSVAVTSTFYLALRQFSSDGPILIVGLLPFDGSAN